MGAGHGEARTWNMAPMVVTLGVSKLSGWLNADAFCGVSKGGHTTLGEVRAGRREAAGDRSACSVHDCKFGAGHGEERTWNMPNMLVTLEVSKLSGWLNAEALLNICSMVVTPEVSQLETSASKLCMS